MTYTYKHLIHHLFAIGVIYHLKKDYDSAEYQYRHALKFDPDLATAKDNLNKLLKTRRKLSRKQ